MIDSFLYLLQRGDHKKHNQDIYKIRRMNNFNRHINEYLLDTQIISVCPIDNEKKGKHEFKYEFEFRNDIGNEYFEGNERDMIATFNDYCSDHLSNRNEEIDTNYHWQIEDQRLAAEHNQRWFKKY
jgi:hypothetical protein